MKKIYVYMLFISFFVFLGITVGNYSILYTHPYESGYTNQNIIATLTGYDSQITGLNSSSHEFTGNGTFEFGFINVSDGSSGALVATVSRIDKIAPTASIQYSTTGTTTGVVIALLTGISESINGLNTGSYVFSGNGSFTFTFADLAGNSGSTIATVNWITGSLASTGTSTGSTGSTGSTSTSTSTTGTTTQSVTTTTGILPPVSTGTMQQVIAQQTLVLRTGANIENSPYSTEMNTAYVYAYGIGITDSKTIKQANIEGKVTRRQLAKVISIFAKKVMNKSLNTGSDCSFSDMKKETKENRIYASVVCQLGLMGIGADGKPTSKFNPSKEVNRAQFGTILSRLLRGSQNDSTDPIRYYQGHLSALQTNNIMTKIDTPLLPEKRGTLFLMLMRIKK